MGKVKRNYKDVDRDAERKEYNGDQPKPGVYDFYLKKVDDHEGGDSTGNKLVWIFECTEDPYTGWAGWVYTNDESAAWKEVQILEALGLLAEGETEYDGSHEAMVKDGGPVRCRVANEKYDGDNRAKIRTIMAPRDGQEKPKAGGSKAKKGKKSGSKKEKSPF